MIPTSFAFLVHKEPLDKIITRHLKEILQQAGYEVIGTLPEPPAELSEERLKEPPVDKASLGLARKELSTTPPPAGAEKNGELIVSDEATDDTEIPWTGASWTRDSDAILDVKLMSFNSDSLQGFWFVSTQGWCRAKVALCDPKSDARRVVWGKTYSGLGTSGPRAVITDDCYSCALNMAYWILVEGIEKQVRNEEFEQHVRSLRSGR